MLVADDDMCTEQILLHFSFNSDVYWLDPVTVITVCWKFFDTRAQQLSELSLDLVIVSHVNIKSILQAVLGVWGDSKVVQYFKLICQDCCLSVTKLIEVFD